MSQVFCGECIQYQGTEEIPNSKSTAWMDTSHPKCAIGKSKDKQDYHCTDYEAKEEQCQN